jgi:hypothetical protein
MSDIGPRPPALGPDDHFETARTRARLILAAGLLFATAGFALVLAGPPLVGFALFLPGVAGAAAGERRLARLCRVRGAHYGHPPYAYGDYPRYGEMSHGDWGFGDWGGGGGDGGGGG